MPIGSWPSGMYYARLTSSKGELGFAPFVLRARRPGVSRVLVVLPTNTWQAYNFRDMDADGVGDTWYANEGIHVVDLARPYLNRGVPSQSASTTAASSAGSRAREGTRTSSQTTTREGPDRGFSGS